MLALTTQMYMLYTTLDPKGGSLDCERRVLVMSVIAFAPTLFVVLLTPLDLVLQGRLPLLTARRL